MSRTFFAQEGLDKARPLRYCATQKGAKGLEAKEIERLLITEFRKKIYRPFCRAVGDYGLIEAGDTIAVCLSGGKDSFLLAKCMQELARHGRVEFTPVFIAMDPGYAAVTRENLLCNARRLGLDIVVYDSDIFDVVRTQACNPCFLCARMRRGHLYHYAMEQACGKIALGHHMDDVNETTLMNLFYGNAVKTMLPLVQSANYPQMKLIRPLYRVREADIEAFWAQVGMTFPGCACGMTAGEADGDRRTRTRMKALLTQLRGENPQVDKSVFTAMHNVRVKDAIGYTDANGVYRKLEE